MSRLAAQEKGEYYPTPLEIVDLIAEYITLPVKGKGVLRLVDTSAGEGKALARLAERLRQKGAKNVETWGVEINPRRAEEAAKRLDSVIACPFQVASWRPAKRPPASVVFQNPPYDNDSSMGERLEVRFLRQGTRWLEPGGLLVWIVPYRVMDYSAASYLYNNYEDIRVVRFPDVDGPAGFKAFGQIVVFAAKRPQPMYASWSQVKNCCWWYDSDLDNSYYIPVIGSDTHAYTPPLIQRHPLLIRGGYTDEEITEKALALDATVAQAMQQRWLPEHKDIDPPLMPPKTGHIAQLIAAGLLGTIEDKGTVLKGQVVKERIVVEETEDSQVVRDKYATHITYVRGGKVVHLRQPAEVTAFLKDHVDVLAQYVAKHFTPYGNSTKPWEAEVLNALSLDKQLPGVSKRGLLPAQRAGAVAMTRSIAKYGVGHLVAEMGFGKTRTALAAIELMNAYPALVICPPHLVDKWKREAEDAVPGTKAFVVESITELEAVRQMHTPGDKTVVIVSRSNIKLGPGWEPAYTVRHCLPPQGTRGEAQRKAFASAAKEYKQQRRKLLAAVKDHTVTQAQRRAVVEARRRALNTGTYTVPTCPDCGQPIPPTIAKKVPLETYLARTPAHCPVKSRKVWDEEKEKWRAEKCGSPLFRFDGFRRWPLADYIRKKAKGFFKVLVADEVHQYKAKDSDQGWAFQLLATYIPRVITLTGTFFGGPSTSIFHLLHRTQKNVRDEFAFNEETLWARTFGVLEEKYKLEGTGEDDYGAFTARRRRKVSTKEKPGITPAIMRFVLPTVYFARIADLGIPMPPLSEEVVTLMPGSGYGSSAAWSRLEADLADVYGATWKAMLANWPHFTSAWLQWNLARPNSAFRDETIEFPDRPAMLVRAVVGEGELLPKEEWLLETVRRELSQGNKVVVYVRQTASRDIRQRLVRVLEDGGIRGVVVLSESIPPRKREKWLAKHHANVLITNPKLVETGLDLVQFSTVIFYEITYSLYTLWQAMRRVWRLGQVKPVKIYYAVYADTLEEKGLALIGEKMAAAQLLYGEDVTGALVPEMGDTLVNDLIKVIKESRPLQGVRSLFTPAVQDIETFTTSPVGSPTTESQGLSVEEFLARHGLTLKEVIAQNHHRRRRKIAVPEAQMPLF